MDLRGRLVRPGQRPPGAVRNERGGPTKTVTPAILELAASEDSSLDCGLSNCLKRLASCMSATLSPSEYYERYWRPNDTWGPSGGGIGSFEQALIKPLAKAGAVCLDYGCGDGRGFGTWLQQLNLRYHGFDISQAAVQVAGTLGLNVGLLTPDGRTTLADDCCDLAICFEVFEHLLEPQLAIQEIRRVLKPGGILLASVPNSADWFRRLEFLMTGYFNPGGSPYLEKDALE